MDRTTIVKELLRVASSLDERGMVKEADVLDGVARRLAARGAWTWSEDATDEQRNAPGAEAKINQLMSQIRMMNDSREQEAWSRRDRDGFDSMDDLDEEDYQRAITMRRERDQQEQEALDSLYEQLGALGAREERPYEHWNEDERYMSYMENRFDDDY